ncbi:MAG: radical SAM protein, partial [Candidatus Aminicenantes bacterium]|nr:radical SAM protein [Candidatus Aminicenantes bacterium]
VPSRRLGYSLGVDIVPFKTCTLDCVYCQLGRTRRTRVRRGDFVPVGDVLAQLRNALASGRHIDIITFSGSGEPTLNRSLGRFIREVKRLTSRPVAVLTNGTLLHRRDVRKDLLSADLVVPSFDAATPALFRRVNRPHRTLRLDRFLAGLKAFRKEFKGRLWLEVMLVKGANDRPAHIARLKEVIAALHPDKVHLNTVVRPPAECWAKPLRPAEMEKVRRALGPIAEVVADFKKRAQPAVADDDLETVVLAMVRRRPLALDDLVRSLGRPAVEVRKGLASLEAGGKIRGAKHGPRVFYEAAESR